MFDTNFEASKQSCNLFSELSKIFLNSPLCGVRISDFFFLSADEIHFFDFQKHLLHQHLQLFFR